MQLNYATIIILVFSNERVYLLSVGYNKSELLL